MLLVANLGDSSLLVGLDYKTTLWHWYASGTKLTVTGNENQMRGPYGDP